MATRVIEQVPRYTISHTDDGTQERLQLTVHLPGITSATDFEVSIQHDKFMLRSQGRFKLELPLHPPVDETPARLQFVKKKALLKAELTVLSLDHEAAAPGSPATSSSRGSSDLQRSGSAQASTQHASGGILHANATASNGHAKKYAARQGPFGREHQGTGDHDAESDSSLPDLVDCDSSSSPTPSSSPRPFVTPFSHGDGVASLNQSHSCGTSCTSDHSSPITCFHTDRQKHQSSTASSDSADSEEGTHVRHSHSNGGYAAAGLANGRTATHPSECGEAGSSQAAASTHSKSHHAESARGRSSGMGSASGYCCAGSQQDAKLASQFFQLSAEAIRDRDFQLAAELLFTAQTLDGTTAPCLRAAMNGLGDDFPSGVQDELGGILADMVLERMSPEAIASGNAHLGPAKSWQEAYEQACIVCLLQAIDHPSAEIYGLEHASEVPQHSKDDSDPQSHVNGQTQGRPERQSQKAKGLSNGAQASGQGQCAHASSNGPNQGQGTQGVGQGHSTQDHTGQPPPLGQCQGPPPSSSSSSQAEQPVRRGTKRPASPQASSQPTSQAAFATASEPQQQQQQQQQPPEKPVAANYGPEEQAEAKRQANKEAAAAWMDRARAAADTRDWSAAVQRCEKALSLDATAAWAKDAHRLIAAGQTALQKGKSTSDSSSDRQTPHQQQQQAKPQQQQQPKQQQPEQQQQQQPEQQQQQQPKQQQPEQQQQQQPQSQQTSASAEQSGDYAAGEKDAESASGSARHGEYSYTYGSNGQPSSSSSPDGRQGGGPRPEPGRASDDEEQPREGRLLQAYTALLVMLQPVWTAIGPVVGPASLIARDLLMNLIEWTVIGLAFLWAGLKILMDVLPLILIQTGKHEQLAKLQAHTQARVWWACLLSYLLSPALGLLSLFGCYWVLCQDPVKWLLWVRIARPVWRCGAVIVGWFQFGWATIPIVGVLRCCFKGSGFAIAAHSYVLWYLMGYTWVAFGAGVLSALLTCRMCYEPWSMPVALKLSHWALTTTDGAGFVYRTGLLVPIWIGWWFWQNVFKDSLIRREQSRDQSNRQSSDPQSADPSSAGGSRPARQGSTDAKSEVKRILAATSHYSVLEVEPTAGEETIRRARRSKSLLVHPDKVGDLPGARDAFDRVTNAAETLIDPAKRRQYDAAHAAPASKPKPSPAQEPAGESDPNVEWQRCTKCGDLHRIIRTSLSMETGRWCRECGCNHPVKQGEGWVTKKSSWFSFGSYEVIIYACLGPTGEIYDVTESSVCHGMLQSAAFRQLGPDSCKVWLSFGPPDSTRHRGKQKVQQETAGGRKNRRQKGRRRR